MSFVDHVFFFLPMLLILATFAAMLWADSSNPLQIFTELPSLFVPALNVPHLR